MIREGSGKSSISLMRKLSNHEASYGRSQLGNKNIYYRPTIISSYCKIIEQNDFMNSNIWSDNRSKDIIIHPSYLIIKDFLDEGEISIKNNDEKINLGGQDVS